MALSRTSTRSSARKIHYYRCLGSDAWRHLGGAVCDTRPIRQDLLDQIVWQEVIRLIEDPTLIARQVVREGVALCAPAGEGPNRRRLRGRLLRRQLVFRGAGRQLFELERQLVDQSRRALRPLPKHLPLELGDPELLRGDKRHVLGGFRPRNRQLRRHFQPARALGEERRLQGGDVVGKGFGSGSHATQRIIVFVIRGARKCV